MADISKSYCLNHPDTPAVARCATCGKHVCAQCVVSRNGSSFCSKACADSAANTAGRVNSAVAAERNIAARARIRTIVILIILAAAAAGGWYYYQGHKDEVDSKVNSAVKKAGTTVQKSMDSTKQTIQKGVPGDSKYKRDREGSIK